ncbi:MAG: HAD hydrolase family protein [Pseudomonadota bacterium]|nr:HAD hydrolase family protein [Pseudomonadota bacterium]
MSAKTVQLMAFDVDGVFTDGTLYYDAEGDALKAFNTLDGLGLKLLQKVGIKTAIVTGRQSPVVERRFSELGVDFIIQGREDKGCALKYLADQLSLRNEEVGYMGDDFPDLTALDSAGFFATVPNAPVQVQQAASFVAVKSGGHGAVRELCEFLLQSQDYDPLTLYQRDPS